MSRLTLTVAILTYKRPQELRLGLPVILEHVATLNAANPANPANPVTATVLVIDNDPAATARDTVRKFDSGLVRYVVEPEPGISAARNRALDEAAGSDLLAFIDDDERPQEHWLLPLLDTWESTGAAAVMGRVVSVFEATLDPWIAAGSFFVRRRMQSGTPIDVAAAGNLLLDMKQVRESGVRFNAEFGLTGAEDTLFSRQLRQAGARIVWCDESVTTDYVPGSRTTRRWVLARSWSHGNSLALVELQLAANPLQALKVRLLFMARGLARVAAGGARYLMGLATRSPRHEARGLRSALRGAGMVAGALGFAYLEYGRSTPLRERFKRHAGPSATRVGAP